MKTFFSNWRSDAPASLVVFLVALPLCLGVSLASTSVLETPNLFAGIIAGVVGGIVVGLFSGSRLGVSGPAAGLIMIVSTSITTLGTFEAFLMAVVLSGVIQIIAGFLRAGVLGNYFPSAVIKGMLAAIGVTLILKEVPHLVGYDENIMGDQSFFQIDGENTFSELFVALNKISPGAVIIGLVSLAILILFDRPFLKRLAIFRILPGALFVVITGVLLNQLFIGFAPSLVQDGVHLVRLPVATNWSEFATFFTFPDVSALANPQVYVVALTIALVGSLESLLSVEATDKLDPEKHLTPTNQELKAQGIGNVVAGLLGGLPITQVIVRSSANINAGGKSKLSTILHGVLLLICAVFIPGILNKIPLATLAAILLLVGYKLSNLGLYRGMYRLGLDQFLPFMATIIGVLLTDLLKGIAIGIVISVFYILKRNYKNNFTQEVSQVDGRPVIRLVLSQEVTFLNKASILDSLREIPENTQVIIDGNACESIDYDVLEVIQEFKDHQSKEKNIEVETINIRPVAVVGGH